MSNVINFPGATKLNLSAERVLNAALKADLETAVVIGWEKDGTFYFASTHADGGDVVWLLELAKRKLLDIACS